MDSAQCIRDRSDCESAFIPCTPFSALSIFCVFSYDDEHCALLGMGNICCDGVKPDLAPTKHEDVVERIQKKIEESMDSEKLDLTGHNVTDETALHVAWALQKNKTWKTCKLWKNSIGSFGAAMIAQAAAHHPQLQGLGFVRNHLGDEGVKQLALAAACDNNICQLPLQTNGIGPKGKPAITSVRPTAFPQVLVTWPRCLRRK